ncbi:CFI-box-CTERM domain-containing protein [Halobacteriaceae archaeon GCM10025711]
MGERDAGDPTRERESGADEAGADGGEGPVEVGDSRLKHVSVVDGDGKQTDHGDVYLRHSNDEFVVSPDVEFPPEETTRYEKASLRRVEVKQHHSMCFITTAAAGEGATLDALRGFRDDALARTPVGRALVAGYYAVSPPIAATLDQHPDARTTRVVRWLVEGCAGLSRRRDGSDSPVARAGLSTLLTLLYVVGVAVAAVGHAGIRVRETVG